MPTDFQRLRVASGGVVSPERFNQLLGLLQRTQLIGFPGFEVKESSAGRVFVPKRGRSGLFNSGPRRFDVTVSGASDPRDVSLVAGTVNNLLPTNMFSSFTTPVTGTRYVVLSLTFSSGEVTSGTIAVNSSPPGASPVVVATPPSTLSVLLAVIVDTVVFQIRRGNVIVISVEQFRADKAAPAAPGELPYNSYWTWTISTDNS